MINWGWWGPPAWLVELYSQDVPLWKEACNEVAEAIGESIPFMVTGCNLSALDAVMLEDGRVITREFMYAQRGERDHRSGDDGQQDEPARALDEEGS